MSEECMNEEYILDMRTRNVELEYKYWQLKVEAAKIELEIAQKRQEQELGR